MGQIPFYRDGEFAGSVDSEDVQDCRHPETVYDGEGCSQGCCDALKCLKCGERFIVEVPD